MPVYEYRCRSCDDVFELSRPMSQSSDPASCPEGHHGAVKLLSRVLVMSGRPEAGAVRRPRHGERRRLLRRGLRLPLSDRHGQPSRTAEPGP